MCRYFISSLCFCLQIFIFSFFVFLEFLQGGGCADILYLLYVFVFKFLYFHFSYFWSFCKEEDVLIFYIFYMFLSSNFYIFIFRIFGVFAKTPKIRKMKI